MNSIFTKWQKKAAKEEAPIRRSDKLLHTFNVKVNPKTKCRPTGLHVNNTTGDIVITDYTEKCVKIFNKKGLLKREIGKGLLKRPWNAVMTLKGEIAVSDPGAPDVKLFTSQGRYIKSFNFVTNFQDPYGLAISGSGDIYVADKGANCVYIYNDEGFMMTSCKPYEEETIIQWPQYVSASTDGDIWLTDYPNHALTCLASNGRLRHRYAETGTDEGQLVCPQGVIMDKCSNVIVVDNANERVQMLTPAGEWRVLVNQDDGLVTPEAVAISRGGHLMVTEGSTGLVKTFRYDAGD